MRRPRHRKALGEYEPYDEYYEQPSSPAATELIDDSAMDPDLVERPFGRTRRPLQSDLGLPSWDYLNPMQQLLVRHTRSKRGTP
jgi:hypothetical protein